MKKKFLSIIIYFLLFIANSHGHVGHYKDYSYLEYELFRNNKSIGYHKYEFERKNNELSVISEVEFKISKLNIDLYKYYAKSVEKYRDGKFFSFASKTNQNKKEKYVNIEVNKKKK